MIADKSINLDTLHKVLFDNENCNPFPAIRLFMVSIRGSAQWHNTE